MNKSAWKYSLVQTLSLKTSRAAEKLERIARAKRLEILSDNQVKQIPTHMTVKEINALFDLVLTLPEKPKILEIGSYLGASSAHLAAALCEKEGQLFCVDTWENQTMPEGERDTFAEFRLNTKGVTNHITAVRKNSRDLDGSEMTLPLNLVFIDGDHSYAGVKSDFQKTADWLVGGGIMAFHDCVYFEGVSKVIGEALSTGNWQLVGHVDNLLWMRKLVKGKIDFAHSL